MKYFYQIVSGWIVTLFLCLPTITFANSIKPLSEIAAEPFISIEPLDDNEFPEYVPAPARPDWFLEVPLDLGKVLETVKTESKSGVLLYFAQYDCHYCERMLDDNFADTADVAFIRQHFAVVLIDTLSEMMLTDFQGEQISEQALAERERAVLTPTLMFYSPTGELIFRLRGYYPPNIFRFVLNYIADAHYADETLYNYIRRIGRTRALSTTSRLNDSPLFMPPPYNLKINSLMTQRGSLVLMEYPGCHTCDVFHADFMHQPAYFKTLSLFDPVQFDLWSDTPLVTPQGQSTTAADWAAELDLFYAPTLLIFSPKGEKLARIDYAMPLSWLQAVLEQAAQADATPDSIQALIRTLNEEQVLTETDKRYLEQLGGQMPLPSSPAGKNGERHLLEIE